MKDKATEQKTACLLTGSGEIYTISFGIKIISPLPLCRPFGFGGQGGETLPGNAEQSEYKAWGGISHLGEDAACNALP